MKIITENSGGHDVLRITNLDEIDIRRGNPDGIRIKGRKNESRIIMAGDPHFSSPEENKYEGH